MTWLNVNLPAFCVFVWMSSAGSCMFADMAARASCWGLHAALLIDFILLGAVGQRVPNAALGSALGK